MWQALLWDHDGVLVDTERLYFQATRELLAETGVELTAADYRRYLLVANTGAWHLAAAQGYDEAAIASLRKRRDQRYHSLLLNEEVLIPGVPQLLAQLHARTRMAVVTSSKRAHFEAIHDRTDLTRYFELILTREDYVLSKPDPEPYRTALARMGLRAEQCLVLEDSERGLVAAKAAGLPCWVIPSELTRESSFALADRRFESFEALQSALLSALT
jgi:HAD superfamily hydrolase (TIGR01509 family)